ncbi:hypothetical protein D0N36_03725 [Hymenobacter lapidiphilus]|uniref:hypothetical protein n=1 Tax=Hymenobacter sp. CCM 8763 TaxID=2303334 RepID=UPI000E34E278|nr:hypothetical protein [Hymenobacter sp. CCM 8763]RFP66467.1 hypothetical protein D0N36_03725 [Hymenobacter sp. CCM 8763]
MKTYEAYEAEIALQNISQQDIDSLAVEPEPTPPINAEAFFYYLHDVYGISMADLPAGFGFTQQGAKISLVFGGIPDLTTLLIFFSVIQTKLTALKLEGINQVTFNAETPDEAVYYNVSSILQPHETLIPTILDHVQLFHANKLIAES